MKTKLFWVPTMKRQNDLVIMVVAYKYATNVYQLKCIENWRIYFRIITFTDICDRNGTKVLAAYRELKGVSYHR